MMQHGYSFIAFLGELAMVDHVFVAEEDRQFPVEGGSTLVELLPTHQSSQNCFEAFKQPFGK